MQAHRPGSEDSAEAVSAHDSVERWLSASYDAAEPPSSNHIDNGISDVARAPLQSRGEDAQTRYDVTTALNAYVQLHHHGSILGPCCLSEMNLSQGVFRG